MSVYSHLPKRVRIVEVGPRDGLQNEPTILPTDRKLAFVTALIAAGVSAIEATSFVSPHAIPQLADADLLFPSLPHAPGVRYSALVPNERGMQRALAAGVRAVSVFTAASESFTQHNIHMSIAGSLEAFRPILALARVEAIPARGYISTAIACPYEGPVPPEAVCRVAQQLADLGVDELSIGDTIGVATPGEVARLVELLLRHFPASMLAVHFHDTRGMALANILTSLLLGVSTIDASTGGLGGCPYAPGASGNVATEDVVYMLDGLGIETGISLDGLCAAARLVGQALGRTPTSKMFTAWSSMQRSSPDRSR